MKRRKTISVRLHPDVLRVLDGCVQELQGMDRDDLIAEAIMLVWRKLLADAKASDPDSQATFNLEALDFAGLREVLKGFRGF